MRSLTVMMVAIAWLGCLFDNESCAYRCPIIALSIYVQYEDIHRTGLLCELLPRDDRIWPCVLCNILAYRSASSVKLLVLKVHKFASPSIKYLLYNSYGRRRLPELAVTAFFDLFNHAAIDLPNRDVAQATVSLSALVYLERFMKPATLP